MGSEQAVCPTCGQPVETVVRRHKTLGAWVPAWVPGPCRNPECEDRLAREAGGTGRPLGARRTPGAAGPRSAEPVEESQRMTTENG